jgi:enamine deaminase RidA (YjgF/YER057c/UK114 family)
MTNRKNIASGAKWEGFVGYSRAVRIGNTMEISGTVSLKDGKIFGQGDPFLQTRRIIKIIDEALQKVDASLSDVIRTRIFVTDISIWEEVGRAHGEAFGDIRPATTMVEVSALIDKEFLVEIEATAIIS